MNYTKRSSPFKWLRVREYVSYSIQRQKRKKGDKTVCNGLFYFLFNKYNFIVSGRFLVVQRLGYMIFTHEIRVRFPAGEP